MDDFDRLKKALKGLNATAEVGAFDPRSATLMGYAEFGTTKAPARPFLTAAYDRNQRAMEAAMGKVLGKILDLKGGTGEDAVRAAGQTLLDKAVEAVHRGVKPPLADSTIEGRRRRGVDEDTPLIDPSLLKPGEKTMISSLKVQTKKGK